MSYRSDYIDYGQRAAKATIRRLAKNDRWPRRVYTDVLRKWGQRVRKQLAAIKKTILRKT